MPAFHLRHQVTWPRLRTVIIPLAGFFVILAILNGYQYYKLKANLAGPIINAISDVEHHDLQHFFLKGQDSVGTI